jgi:hypothetical protein
MESWDGPPDSQFDGDAAEGYVGKYLLVGITRVTNEGVTLSLEQLHGVINSVNAHGIELQLKGVNEGKVWRMPPFLDRLSVAAPGVYQLKATGEAVEDPDFTFTMTIRKPAQQ